MNLDEEGHESYADSIKQVIVVSKELEGPFYYPVTRKNYRTSFLACICADGEYLNPLIIIKRKTVDTKFVKYSLFDKVLLDFSESGFINGEIFDHWLEKVFEPYLQQKIAKFNYSGPSILIIDGCTAHCT